ncbi:hypothetical protein Bbelb_402590 [Branchiostoma belcheri]|nr:hypothetical protein Bbelb_402590 [Branchiostoma belcheri]
MSKVWQGAPVEVKESAPVAHHPGIFRLEKRCRERCEFADGQLAWDGVDDSSPFWPDKDASKGREGILIVPDTRLEAKNQCFEAKEPEHSNRQLEQKSLLISQLYSMPKQ